MSENKGIEIYPERIDHETKNAAEEWAKEGCLPETSDVEEELKALEKVVANTPEDQKESVVELIAARTFLAAQHSIISADVCKRVLEILNIENTPEEQVRLLKLVKS